ncbi:hypothetical protein [Parasediminibacterium sp. JCM 36343]|uniref:hypothetical protein n=1 Tax=Parasediminibacterium sp. JCM 36343 TaxID=3374279 RepID=UPI00397C9B1B
MKKWLWLAYFVVAFGCFMAAMLLHFYIPNMKGLHVAEITLIALAIFLFIKSEVAKKGVFSKKQSYLFASICLMIGAGFYFFRYVHAYQLKNDFGIVIYGLAFFVHLALLQRRPQP